MLTIKFITKGKKHISKIIQNNLILKQNLSFNKNGKDIVPDEFYDEVVESEKEFCDLSMTLIQQKGLEDINTIKENYSWNDLSPFSPHPIVDDPNPLNSDPDFTKFVSQLKSYKSAVQKNSALKQNEMEKLKQQIKAQLSAQQSLNDSDFFDSTSNLIDDSGEGFSENIARRTLGLELPEALSNIEDSAFFTPHELNPSMGHSLDEDDLHDDALRKFIPETDPNKYKSDEQGRRECPGGMQRRKKEPNAPLRCHLIDIDQLNPIDIPNLKRFLSMEGEILTKKLTGLCARCQRQVARTIKHARNMGIIPHLGYVHVADLRPSRVKESFHEVVPGGGKKGKPILSKLVLTK